MIPEHPFKTRFAMVFLVLLTVVQVITLITVMKWLPLTAQRNSTIRTLPILSPVSLQYEEALRDGEPPANLHGVVERVLNVDPTKVPKENVEQFIQDRLSMLSLRNERHELNVRLMESGVSLLEELSPEQWEMVQSQRDQIQSNHEMKAMEKLLQKWSD